MRPVNVYISVFFLAGWTAGCGTDSGPETYTVTANPTPIEAGEVSPTSAKVKRGESHTLHAFSNEGWEFLEWSGAISSTDNPLMITVERDMSLMANFIDIRSVYSLELELFDGTDRIPLELGQDPEPTSKNKFIPPAPPAGSLHGYIQYADEQWWSNYQSELKKETEWQLHFQVGQSQAITLNWQVYIKKMKGNLTITVGNEIIDMNQLSNFEITTDIESPLMIQYQFERQ